MRKRHCGFAIAALKRRAKVGDYVIVNKQSWMIQAEGRSRERMEKALEASKRYQAEKIEKGWSEKYEWFKVYNFKVRKIKRQRDYRQYDWYQLLKREVAQ